MASANVELVRSIYPAWERGDFSSAEWAHPEIEFVVADGPAPGSWTGLAGMAEGVRDGLNVWEEGFRPAAEEYRELDNARVLVLIRFSGRGKTSGLEIGQMRAQGAHLFHIREGKVTRHVHYWDRERAFTELGLAPESDSVMASANVELVRSIYADWERGDYRSTEWADPEIEVVFADGPSPGTWTGLAGMVEAFRDAVNVWAQYRIEADEYRELDHGRVLVLTHYRGRGKTSGVEVGELRARGADVFHVRDGKVTKRVLYFNREPALADLGLVPESGSP
jgi:ketosteroid isomerase-like protein